MELHREMHSSQTPGWTIVFWLDWFFGIEPSRRSSEAGIQGKPDFRNQDKPSFKSNHAGFLETSQASVRAEQGKNHESQVSSRPNPSRAKVKYFEISTQDLTIRL